MAIDSPNTDTNILGKCNLDGTEVYGEDGQTVANLETLILEEINKLLEGSKDGDPI